MEAINPTSVCYFETFSLHALSSKNVIVKCKLPAFRQTAILSGCAAFDAFHGDFPNQGSTFRVEGRRGRSAVCVRAIDAAQPFDYESKRAQEPEKSGKLKVGIVGFGNFGQFLAERILKHGHKVLAHSRRDYSDKAQRLGVTYFRSVGYPYFNLRASCCYHEILIP